MADKTKVDEKEIEEKIEVVEEDLPHEESETEETIEETKVDSSNFVDDVDTGDKLGEYFQIKDQLRTLRGDLRDLKEEHKDYAELDELTKQIKVLRENIKNDENIRIVQEKIADLKERQELLKEIIKVEMKETDQTEVKMNGRKLKLIDILKEMKDEGN